MPNGESINCVLGNTNKTRIDALEKSDQDQWRDINTLKNRLPVWATFVFAALAAVVGWLVKG